MPATETWLSDPYAVAVDGRDFYIADAGHFRIRKVTGGVAPATTAQPGHRTVAEGGNTAFAAEAVGNPAPTVIWQTSTDGSTWFDLDEGGPYSGVSTSTLTITAATASLDGRQFRLVATNNLGTAESAAASLTVTAAGPVNGPPYTLTITPATGGKVQGAGINCGAGGTSCSVTMPASMTLGIGATASAGYTFTAWAGDCAGPTPDLWIALNGPRTCAAVFTPAGGTPAYQLTIAPAPAGGLVSGPGLACGAGGATCQVAFGSATTTLLTATPSSGFAFSSWGGACSGTTPTTTIMVDAARTCTATFTATGGGPVNGPPYTLTISPTTGGNIAGAGINCGAGGTACSVTMPASMTLGIGATPSAGYTFSGWTGDCSGANPSIWVALNGPRTCGAIFTPAGGTATYQLTIAPTPAGGTVTGAGLTCGTGGSACVIAFGGATTASLLATPATGYAFTSWGGACAGTSTETTVLVDAARSCSATFTATGGGGTPPTGPPYTLTVTSPAGGKVQGAGINCGAGGTACSVTMPAAMMLGMTATASTGYTFTAWTGDCTGTSPSQWVSLNGPRACGATFTPVGGGGGGTPTSGIITTIAGTGTQGFGGDGGSATLADLWQPSDVTVDGAGSIYFVDYSNNRIRKIAAGTGIITTVAGTGDSGFSGDGGQATAATLGYPYSAAVDGAGHLYIADYWNNRIRKVNATTGIITTVAGSATRGYSGDGGLATAALIDAPYRLAVTPAGDVLLLRPVQQRGAQDHGRDRDHYDGGGHGGLQLQRGRRPGDGRDAE